MVQRAPPPLLDSGANGHFFNNRKRFHRLTPVYGRAMRSASGNKCTITAKGDVGRLHGAHLVDGLATEMISISKLYNTSKRWTTFGDDVWQHDLNPALIPSAKKIGTMLPNGLYAVDEDWLMGRTQLTGALGDILPKDKFLLAHARLGHLSYRSIGHAIASGNVTGLPFNKKEVQSLLRGEGPACTACLLSQTIKRKVKKNMQNTHIAKPSKPFELICIDIATVTPPSKFGDVYFLLVICVYTNDMWVIPLRSRADAGPEFDAFLEEVGIAYKANLKNFMTMRTDGAKELTQGRMATVLKKWGLRRKECTSPYSSYQNANAERAIRTVGSMARAMMVHAGAPRKEWIYALRTATYILRRLPTTANPGRQAPIQMMLGKPDSKVNLSILRTWYSPVTVRKQLPERTKSRRFDETGWPGVFLGYKEGTKGYVVRIPGRGVFTRSPQDVYFVEDMNEAKRVRREMNMTENTKTNNTDTTDTETMTFTYYWN